MTGPNGIVLRVVMVLALAVCASAQCETVKLLPATPVPEDEFGCAVAIENDWAIIGAYLNDDRAWQSGAAFVFRRTDGTWKQTQQLLTSDGQHSDQFGSTVALSGNLAVIGAPSATSTLGPFTRTGAAYVFERTGERWEQRAKLVASDPSQQALFSSAVAISGQRIVVGAWGASPVGLHSGVAYVFEGSGSIWNQVAYLLPPELGSGDLFGFSVAIHGDRLIVGAPGTTVSGFSTAGVAFVFERNALGAWIQQQRLPTPNPSHHEDFGGSVAIEGDSALVGAPFHLLSAGDRGAVYAYERTSGIWTNTQFVPGTHGNGFGSNLVLQNDTAIIYSSDDDQGSGAGAVYVYHRTGFVWQRTGKILANDGAAVDVFGATMALDGRTVLLGALRDDVACPTNILCNSGSAYIVELAPTAIQYGHCTAGGSCMNPDVHGGCRNGTGQGAFLQACGSGSVALDDLRFEARKLPPGTSALLFMGGAQTNVPFGNGRRVVAGGSTGLFRLGIQTADASGVITRGPGLVAQSFGLAATGHITAGSTWNLQYWYRDLAGPCQGGFNLTNGLQITFMP